MEKTHDPVNKAEILFWIVCAGFCVFFVSLWFQFLAGLIRHFNNFRLTQDSESLQLFLACLILQIGFTALIYLLIRKLIEMSKGWKKNYRGRS